MLSMPDTSRARYAGLDGLRAIAVVLVVVYHLFPGWIFAGGFVGVDVFFVISGFLITSLLLGERRVRGRISLPRFWQRRTRRLLPALAVVVTVCASAAWIIGGDVLVRIGAQLLATATFSFNWVSIAGGADYFTAATPELFRNLWSLAVEEQFYVLWPLLLPLLLLVPRRAARSAVALVAAAASAIWMGVLAGAGELTRAYFGTDSHSFGLLLGIALAVGLEQLARTPPPVLARRRWRVGSAVVGVAALVALLGVAMLPDTGSALTFPGALLAGSLLTVLVLVAAMWPGSRFGAALDTPALRWIGRRSYALYLWHWPLLVLLLAATTGMGPASGVPVWVSFLVLALTVLAAELSYRFVEMPVRRHGFRGSLRRLSAAVAGRPARRFGALVGVAATALIVGGTVAAVSNAPAQTSAEAAVQAGLDALAHPAQPRVLLPADQRRAAPAAAGRVVTGDEISAVGDSVMLASAPALVERFPGIQVDASVSRSMYAGPGILEQLAASGQLREYVVVALGTNGAIDRESLDRIAAIVGPERELILVTAFAPRDWIPGVNGELSAFADEKRGVELADWSTAIAGRVDLLAGDQVHPGASGGQIFAQTVADAIGNAEVQRAGDRSRLRMMGDQLLAAPRV